jgi:nicotinate-nucleotide adenylyltransferase
MTLLAPARPPPFVPGLKVGLFGGSFNPPHDGHREASLLALRRLQLHRIWWHVSPANPLKDACDLAPLALRLDAARKVSRHVYLSDDFLFETALSRRAFRLADGGG